MTRRYWNAGTPPDVLLDWVNDNVVAALYQCWEEDPPSISIDEGPEEPLTIVVYGPDKPTEDNPLGTFDIFTAKCDLMDALKEYATPYDSGGGPNSEAQREDVRERAAKLRELEKFVSALAATAEAAAPASS